MFPECFNDILSLAFFSICDNSPFYMYPSWLTDHYIVGKRSLHSSDISSLCQLIGKNGKNIYNFFEQWISNCNPKSGVYFDITSISSDATNFEIENKEFIAHFYYNEKTEVVQKQQFYTKLFEIEDAFKSKKFETRKKYVNYCNENIKKQYMNFLNMIK